MTQETKRTTGAELLKIQPDWAQAIIVAQWHENESDAMTDYFNHKTTREVVLAWSRHTRDLFPEMRTAAARFEPTAHLGPKMGDFSVSVNLANDFMSGGTACWAGDRSPWHRETLGSDANFSTREEAEAWIAQAPELRPMNDGQNGENVVRFEYRITEQSVEHREKWSMGHGYYLKHGYTHSTGWAVKKSGFWLLGSRRDQTIEEIVTVQPAESARSRTSFSAVEIAYNADQKGVELRFPTRPSEDVRDRLKAQGWQWSRFSGCWYTRDTSEARVFAEAIVAELRVQ